MKEKMKLILDNFHKYNSAHTASMVFGFDEDIEYDALVIDPGFTPYKLRLHARPDIDFIICNEGTNVNGYLIKKDNLNIAWIKTGVGAQSVIDHLVMCAELKFKKIIFIGAVGALKPGYMLGDICVPEYSYSCSYVDSILDHDYYATPSIHKVYPSARDIEVVKEICEKQNIRLTKAPVFCTPTFVLEYSNLEFFRERADLIEMETASVFKMSDLLEVPVYPLLIVSDNSAAGIPLLGRSKEQDEKYYSVRQNILPELIFELAKVKEK